MNIIFVRHGQSEGNVDGIIQGHSDYPLTDLGKKEAKLVGEYFKKVDVDALYSSDLKRAMSTANDIEKRTGLTNTTMERLREIHLGELEGKKRIDVIETYPFLKTGSVLTAELEGAETVEAITKRCRDLKAYMLENHADENIVVVSHGGFISIFLIYLLIGEKWPENYRRPFLINNTGITKVEVTEERATILYVNRLPHLERIE